MTTKKISKTIAVGNGGVTTFNALTELGGSPHHWDNLRITVLNASAIVSVAWNGATAAVAGDDVKHIGPFGSETIRWADSIDLRSDTAATNVEIAGA